MSTLYKTPKHYTTDKFDGRGRHCVTAIDEQIGAACKEYAEHTGGEHIYTCPNYGVVIVTATDENGRKSRREVIIWTK